MCLTWQDEISFVLPCHRSHRMTTWKWTGWWDRSPFSIPPLDLMTITMIGAEALCEWAHLLQLLMSNTMPFDVDVPLCSLWDTWVTFIRKKKKKWIRYCSTQTLFVSLGRVSRSWVTSSWSPKLFPWQWGACGLQANLCETAWALCSLDDTCNWQVEDDLHITFWPLRLCGNC